MFSLSRSLQIGVVVLFGVLCALYLTLDHTKVSVSLPQLAKLRKLKLGGSSWVADDGHLHLLVPATSSNHHFCRLLYSARVLRYPTPHLINWAAQEDPDPYVQHIAKIDKILAYLQTFSSDKNDDLVLIVDGYDVWFQLPVEVMIRRFFTSNKAANRRIAATFSSGVVKKHDLRQSVIFGSDKLCWPSDGGRRPACWAPPQSPLPLFAFGDLNDTDVNDAIPDAVRSRPRWLNSGCIMGTVADVREVFVATLAELHENPTSKSDQFHFSNVFAEQEYARILLEKHPEMPSNETIDLPIVKPGKRTEYHIGLDYESGLFQNLAYYQTFLSWLWFDGPEPMSDLKGKRPSDPHGFNLPNDILEAPSPFLASRNGTAPLPYDLGWRDLALATNVVTKQVFALLHFTFEKDYRDLWWDKMWYYPYGKSLLQASVSAKKERAPVIDLYADGRSWRNAEASHIADPDQLQRSEQGEMGGAWSDRGIWVSWDEMCMAHEASVFRPGT